MQKVRHWFLLGEITSIVTCSSTELRLILRTHFSEMVSVILSSESPTPSFVSLAQPGQTLAIMYAERSELQQQQSSKDVVEVVEMGQVYLFYTGLDVLMEEANSLDSFLHSQFFCFHCHKRVGDITGGKGVAQVGDNSSIVTSLSLCSRCMRALYCSPECQRTHWEESHHMLCRQMCVIEAMLRLRTVHLKDNTETSFREIVDLSYFS